MRKRILVWFRNDLRVHDNETLYRACLDAEEIIPVFCISKNLLHQTFLGIPRIGSRRLQFLLETIIDLKESLRLLGGDLKVIVGEPEEKIPEIAESYEVQAVYFSSDASFFEKQQEQNIIETLASSRVDSEIFWTSTLISKSSLPFSINQLPPMFTTFRQKVEKECSYPVPLLSPEKIISPKFEDEIPSIESLGFQSPDYDMRSAFPFKGGETEALKHVQNYIWENELISTYKETRNGMVGPDYSGKFSPWLANGSLSARTIAQEVFTFEKNRIKNESTYWMIFELLWRDFFKFTFDKNGPALFQKKGLKALAPELKFHSEKFKEWCEGETEDEFVNANMKELKYTGWMSNRGRQNVASYLIHDLQIDWRYGAAYFEQQLLDYDASSNWGNWAYVAGVGNDPRPFRKFNTEKQAKDYDKDKKFRNLWLTEN